MRLSGLYAPQGVDPGEDGSLSHRHGTAKWLAWAELETIHVIIRLNSFNCFSIVHFR